MEQLQNFADTAGAEAMREQFRCCCVTTVLWTIVMNEHKLNKTINREDIKNVNITVLVEWLELVTFVIKDHST